MNRFVSKQQYDEYTKVLKCAFSRSIGIHIFISASIKGFLGFRLEMVVVAKWYGHLNIFPTIWDRPEYIHFRPPPHPPARSCMNCDKHFSLFACTVKPHLRFGSFEPDTLRIAAKRNAHDERLAIIIDCCDDRINQIEWDTTVCLCCTQDFCCFLLLPFTFALSRMLRNAWQFERWE